MSTVMSYQPCQYLAVMYTVPVLHMAYSMGTLPKEVLFYHGVGYKQNFMTGQVRTYSTLQIPLNRGLGNPLTRKGKIDLHHNKIQVRKRNGRQSGRGLSAKPTFYTHEKSGQRFTINFSATFHFCRLVSCLYPGRIIKGIPGIQSICC